MKAFSIDDFGGADFIQELLKQRAIDEATDTVLGILVVWLIKNEKLSDFIKWANDNEELFHFECRNPNDESHKPGDHHSFLNEPFSEKIFNAFTHAFIDDLDSEVVSNAYHSARGLEPQNRENAPEDDDDNLPVIDVPNIGMYL